MQSVVGSAFYVWAAPTTPEQQGGKIYLISFSL
jgi:hypothetical protein